MPRYFGTQREELLGWLSGKWLEDGPPVCFVEGFSGVGKTAVGLDLATKVKVPTVHVDLRENRVGVLDDLLLDLATELSAVGIDDLAKAIDAGEDLLPALDMVLLRPVIIVIDEFQRSFEGDTGRPVKALGSLFTKLARRPSQKGRILLLGNRLVNRGPWSDPFEIRTLTALRPTDAESLLRHLLDEQGRADDVPPERTREVVNWLGCNPRAIRTLVAALATESLDELLEQRPDLWEARERAVSPEFLRDLEEYLLDKTIAGISDEAEELLRMLSVHRRPVKREALERLVHDADELKAQRDELVSRFLMEQRSGYYPLNQIAREIMLRKIADDGAALRKAHSEAADYYARHFKGERIVDGGKLAGHFVDARHHLLLAGRGDELDGVVQPYISYILKTFGVTPPVPTDEDELNERIAMLSIVLEQQGPEVLEYHLAKLFKVRGGLGDIERALLHAQRSTGPRVEAAPWVLRVELEAVVNGVDRAVEVGRQGIEEVPPGKNLFALYQSCAEMLDRAGRTPEAVSLLKEGIGKVPADKALHALYVSCAEMLDRLGSTDEAVKLLKQGIEKIPAESDVRILYQSCAEILAADGKVSEAIVLLREGMRAIPVGIVGRYGIEEQALLYAASMRDGATIDAVLAGTGEDAVSEQSVFLGRILRKELGDDWAGAVGVARVGRARFPTYFDLATHEALCLLGLDNPDSANKALDRFPGTLDPSNVNGWLKAFIALRRGEAQSAAEALSAFLGRPLGPDETPTETMLLRIWDDKNYLKAKNAVSYIFPILPPAMTGLPEIAVRPPYGPPVLPWNALGGIDVPIVRSEVFISYSHKDEKWLETLRTHLKPYQRAGSVSAWSDKDIETGDDWREEIEKALARAKVAVLLVSPDFLDSDFIYKEELPPLLEAAKSEGLTIVWVPISASSYHKTEIAKYQAAHEPADPLDGLSKWAVNEALVAICEKIEKAANA